MKYNRLILFVSMFAALAVLCTGNVLGSGIVATAGLCASVPWSAHQPSVFAFNPFFGLHTPLFKDDPEDHGGGMSAVIAGVKTIQDNQTKLLTNYDQLSRDTKKAMEELTLTKNRMDSAEDILKSMRKMQKMLALESRSAFGITPAQRIAYNEEKRNLFIARFAKSLGILDHAKEHIRVIAKDLDTGNTPGSASIANNELERDIYDLLATYGAFNKFDVRRIGATTAEIRLKTARVAAVFVDEAAAIGADSTKAGSKVTCTPKKIGALISASSELLEDDVGGIIEDVLNDIAESIAYRIDWICLAADGGADSTDGGFTGILGGGGTDRTAASGNTTVATLDYEDWLACVTNMPTGLLQRGGLRWTMNPTILAKSALLKDTTGRPLFQTALEAPIGGAVGSILGYPVDTAAAAPSTDSAGARLAALGDPMALGVRIRKDITFDRSKDWAFDTDEITFRGTARAGSKVKAATAFQVLKSAAS